MQRRRKNFEEQTHKRMAEYNLLQLAALELDGRAPWSYYEEKPINTEESDEEEDLEADEMKQTIGGEAFYAYYRQEDDKYYPVCLNKTRKDKDYQYSGPLMEFLWNLNQKLYDYIPVANKILPLYTLHVRKGVIFRSSMNLHGQVWMDWALINGGADGDFPCHIHGFLDLKFLPGNVPVEVGTVVDIDPGYYAIVEYGEYIDLQDRYFASELFRPIAKEFTINEGEELDQRKFYLIDVDTFKDVIAVVPDISEEQNHYFEVVNRDQWAADFEEWLQAPYTDNDDLLLEGEECPN